MTDDEEKQAEIEARDRQVQLEEVRALFVVPPPYPAIFM